MRCMDKSRKISGGQKYGKSGDVLENHIRNCYYHESKFHDIN